MIVIDRGRHPIRGFLSYYISILTSFKKLLNDGYKLDDIRIDPYMFYTYGEASNWFDASIIASPQEGDNIFYSTDSWDIDPWPSKKQLDLLQYKKYFDYNEKTKNYLKDNLFEINNCVGIHFRGTDHYHTDRVDVEYYIQAAKNEIKKRNSKNLFIATDEEGIIESIQNAITDVNIIFNQTTKSSNGVSVFDKKMSLNDKISSGFEVLIDSHSLAKCDVVIGKLSNVNYYSRILNPGLEVIYLDKGSTVR